MALGERGRGRPRRAGAARRAVAVAPAAARDAGLGGGADPATPLPYTLTANAVTETHPDGPRLAAPWTWPGALLTEDEVRQLATAWFDALRALVACAELPGAGGGLVPSDLPLVDLLPAPGPAS